MSIQENDTFRDTLATVDQSGKRVWIYPKMPKGIWYNRRKIVSYILLVLLFGAPFIKVDGEPLFLFNVLEGKFNIFGFAFTHQDFYLFVFAMLIFLLFIVLFTAAFGRLFCGWVCPQTIFMEMFFRRIEYAIEGDANAQRRLDAAPWTRDKIMKKSLKQGLFIIISILIAHTFLSYIIGADEVYKIITDPISQHLGGFAAMVVFTIVFYGVFSVLREQVCTTICPYGRLQGVMVDSNSLAVTYDFVRGEPRGKMLKARQGKKSDCTDGCSTCKSGGSACPADLLKAKFDAIEIEAKKGDCVDCGLCVQVCPTGIDIRDGIQLECINCTACMDACDEVMVKVDRPTGLIRLDSLNAVQHKEHKFWTKRILAYTGVLLVLIVLESFLLFNRSMVDLLVLRTPGTMYIDNEDGYIRNLYQYQLINKTRDSLNVKFEVTSDVAATLEVVGTTPTIQPTSMAKGALFIKIPKDKIDKKSYKIVVIIRGADGKKLQTASTNFMTGYFK